MKQSLLWKLTKEGHCDSFILGTMHVKSERAFGRLQQLKEIIPECQLFAAEYDLDFLQQQQSRNDMLIPNGLTIKDVVGASKFKRMRAMLQKSFYIDLELLMRFLPLVIVNVISEAALTKDHKLPLDLYLWKFASENGLEMEGIESYSSQLQILSKIKLKDQIKMINSIVRNPGNFRRGIERMADWYQEEKISKLYKNGKKTLGKYKGILLKNRNYIMAARFAEMSFNKNLFFAVGAGHLAGNHGVLKLLKDKGWKLKAI